MTQVEATNRIHDLMKLCKIVMFKATSGFTAEYASAVGNACKDALINIDRMSGVELESMVNNIAAYESILNSLIA